MSSFLCEAGKCTFTRVDTDGYVRSGLVPFPPEFGPDGPIFSGNNSSNVTDDTSAPWTDPVNQDLISETVAITRDFRGGIFNAIGRDTDVEDPFGDHFDYERLAGSEWALLPEGKTFEESRCGLYFCSWLDCFVQYNSIDNILNKPGVVHLIDTDEYYNIMFTNWTSSYDDEYYFQVHNEREPKPWNRRAQESRMIGPRNMKKRYQKQGKRRLEEDWPEEEWNEDEWNDDNGMSHVSHDAEDCFFTNYGQIVCGGEINGEPGGGFQYVRDELPIAIDPALPDCPNCNGAEASPRVLTGAVDDSFQEVTIEGVTPADVNITILAVGQDQSPKCNRAVFQGTDQVRPNAKGVGNSTVMLRRTRPVGKLSPMRYTLFYSATNAAGSCNGQTEVCSPPFEGMDCNGYYHYGYDATATRVCDA